jgi:murein DD-endopeptidase MepM/ murein hydrolase activator NlpD
MSYLAQHKHRLRQLLLAGVAGTSLLGLSACLIGGAPNRAPVIHYGAERGAGSAGMHTVIDNENIWRISKNYAIPMQELIVRNRLVPPYVLKVGQRLDIPPPRQYTVKSGDTIFEIARLFSLSMSRLVRLNSLSAPYNISIGQVLKLPMSYDLPVAKKSSAPMGEQYVHMSVPVSRPQNATGTSANKQTRQAKQGTPKKRGSKYIKTKIPPRSSSRFAWPLKGKILSSYGSKNNGLYNDGINIAMPRGSAVKASGNGVVVYTGDEISGYGNLVLIKHVNGWISAYAHLDRITAVRGDTIKRGVRLGTVGSTGNVDTPQLHFELRQGAQTKNPLGLLAKH